MIVQAKKPMTASWVVIPKLRVGRRGSWQHWGPSSEKDTVALLTEFAILQDGLPLTDPTPTPAGCAGEELNHPVMGRDAAHFA